MRTTNESSQPQLSTDNCENEPIHIPGSVQPHGVLIAVRQSDFTILQISENVYSVLGIPAEELLHQPLSKLMSLEPVERASRRLGERVPRLLNPIPLEISVRGEQHFFDGILHRSGRIIVLELEPHIAEKNSAYGGFGGFYEAVRDATSRLMNAQSLEEVMGLMCDEMRRLTGFSRVLVYQFDEEWNGQVIAESREDHVASLMFHRFPAGDIPKQARQLYAVNWLRLIPTANYTPARLTPPNNPLTDNPLDLSSSVLRSVSPIHLEYMRNMGQMASMSVSLLKGGKLWGLISCHHPEPLFLEYNIRVAAEFLGQMVSAQVVAREDAASADHRVQLKAIYDSLLKRGGTFAEVMNTLKSSPSNVLALADAVGAAIFVGDDCAQVGSGPIAEVTREIFEIVLKSGEPVYVTNQLIKVYPRAKNLRHCCSGILAITVPWRGQQAAVIWFRPELKEQIPWAGNPHLAKEVSPDGKIHPRTSFATWVESTTDRTKPWKTEEIDAVTELRATLSGLSAMEHPAEGFLDQGKSERSFEQIKVNRPDLVPTAEERHGPDGLSVGDLAFESLERFAGAVLNREGVIQRWSAGAEKIFGYHRGETIGKNVSMLFAEEDVLKNSVEKIFDRSKNHGRAGAETWLFKKSGSSFWARIEVTKVNGVGASQIGYAWLAEDLTEERSVEEELKSAKLAADAANVAKSSFVANISHEIRTPLSAMLGFAQILKRGGGQGNSREMYLDRIVRNGDHLLTIVNDLLDITKLEAGKLEVELLPCNLRAILSEVTQTLSFKASENGVTLKLNVNPKIPDSIMSDPTRVRQIILNLIGNATKFTPSGGNIEISCELNESSRGKFIALRVTDTGKGMTALEMARLFEPFVQADVSTTRNFGGTGLGLYVSRKLARALNGDLTIERSAVGIGSTFLLALNLNDISSSPELAGEPAPLVNNIRAGTTGERKLLNKKILIVDDSADNRQIIGDFLSDAGALTEFAADGLEAVAKAKADNFDVVVMDIQMPKMDGNQAIKELKLSGYGRPVMALTAHGMAEERERSLKLGFVDYLTKPIEPDVLIDRVAVAIGL